jgi:type IV pilus assembly protein PilV
MKSSNGFAPAQGYRRAAGFSLVEVMVALIVMSVGLLGIAKMQALALSSTTSARTRSLAALEASSLASTMRADRAYWANVTADPDVQFSAGAITKTADPTLQLNNTCPCTPPQLAYDDLSGWATDLNSQLPSVNGTVQCKVPPAAGPQTPVSCTISLTWSENEVISNAQQTTTPTTINYTLHVDP